MNEPHEELLSIADAMDRLVERGGRRDVREPLERLESAANEVAKAWSGSWLGYHAHVYYKDLGPRPPGAHFSQESGFSDSFMSDTTGEWREFDAEHVKATIHDRAGNPNLRPSQKLCEDAVRVFETHKLKVLSLIESTDSSGNFLNRLEGDVAKSKIPNQTHVLVTLKPSGQFVSRDMRALNQGLWTPPHISVLVQVFATRLTFNAVENLAKLARQAGSHLWRLQHQRRARQSEIVGTNVFIGHGRSPIWRELKDFIEDRLHLPVDEFNSMPVAGVTNISRLLEMMDAAVIAFLVMTGEDEQPDGQLRARMNVVHEAGLFQGRLGFTRAIVVLEDGCEEFSNITGLGQIRFPQGNIGAAFEQVREVLEREGVLSAIE